MLKTLKTMAERYNRYMTFVARKRTCEILLNSSDRMLEDGGFSRELLQKGVAAWPWQATDDDQNMRAIRFDSATTRKAILELQSYSENELHDLGITRGTIKEAVRHGRVGIDGDTERKAA